MYDKITMFLPIVGGGVSEIGNVLDEAKIQTDLNTGVASVYGRIENLKVSAHPWGIHIIGSWAKYLYGSNIYTLNRHDTPLVIEKISDTFKMDVEGAKVTSIEFGTQFIMRKPVEEYFTRLGDSPNLRRSRHDGTVYYKSRGKKRQSKTLCFYDKRLEMETKGVPLPDGLEDANILRYEMRLKKNLPQLLKANVFASTLSNEDFYRRMVKLWQESYFLISKINKQNKCSMDGIKTTTDAFNMLMAQLINQGGDGVVSEFLDALKAANVFADKKNYSRLKRKISEVQKKAALYSEKDEEIMELDDEVNNAGAYL